VPNSFLPLAAFSFVLIPALVGCASGPPARPAQLVPGDQSHLASYLDWAVPIEMDRAGVPGVALAVISREGPVWLKGYGMTGAGGTPVGPGTPFRVGSVSKPVTAALVLRYVAEGRLALDRPVAETLPVFTPRSRFGDLPITPRMLLAHRSGLPSDELRGMWTNQPADAAMSATLAGRSWLAAEPGTAYKYSNLGYGVLGRLAELASGLPFAEAAGRDLLRPLGMVSSSYATPPGDIAPARPHRNGKPAPETGLREVAAGSLWSTADDMGRFLQALLSDGQVGGVRLPLADMLREQYPEAGERLGQRVGLGWMLAGNAVAGVGETVWHNGAYPGYFAHVAMLPAEGLGVVVLANGEEASRFAMQLGVRTLALAVEGRTGRRLPEPQADTPAPATVPEAELDAAVGRYVVMGQLTPIVRAGGRLKTEFQGTTIELLPLGKERFLPRASMLGLLSVPLDGLTLSLRNQRGRRLAVLEGAPEPLPFERVEPMPLPDAWRRRLGRYVLVDRDDWVSAQDVRLVDEDGVPVLRMRLESPLWGATGDEARIAIRPLSDDSAIVSGQGNSEGGVIEAGSENGAPILTYSGFRFRWEGP